LESDRDEAGRHCVRKNFAKQADAIRERNDLDMEASGEPETRRALRTILTGPQLADAEAATQHAGPLKLSKVVTHYLSLRDRARSKGVDLDQAIAFVEARYRPEAKEITIFNAVREFLDSRVGLSTKTLANYEHNLGLLLKRDPNRPVHAFTITDIEKEMKRYRNVNTRRTMRRVFSVFSTGRSATTTAWRTHATDWTSYRRTIARSSSSRSTR